MIANMSLPKPAKHGQKDQAIMRAVIVAALSLPLVLGGCVSFSSSNPPPPAGTTIVVPPGTTVVCTDGTAPPCRY
jgi:hypothetical protein